VPHRPARILDVNIISHYDIVMVRGGVKVPDRFLTPFQPAPRNRSRRSATALPGKLPEGKGKRVPTPPCPETSPEASACPRKTRKPGDCHRPRVTAATDPTRNLRLIRHHTDRSRIRAWISSGIGTAIIYAPARASASRKAADLGKQGRATKIIGCGARSELPPTTY
jgi:hypothetical protein